MRKTINAFGLPIEADEATCHDSVQVHRVFNVAMTQNKNRVETAHNS